MGVLVGALVGVAVGADEPLHALPLTVKLLGTGLLLVHEPLKPGLTDVFAATLPFAEDLLAAYYCAFDRQTPRHVQAALLGALAYFILPFDFIPDMLPVLGFTDDAAVLAAAIRTVASHITPAHRDAAREMLRRGIGNDTSSGTEVS